MEMEHKQPENENHKKSVYENIKSSNIEEWQYDYNGEKVQVVPPNKNNQNSRYIPTNVLKTTYRISDISASTDKKKMRHISTRGLVMAKKKISRGIITKLPSKIETTREITEALFQRMNSCQNQDVIFKNLL